jgi:hypothetical protein
MSNKPNVVKVFLFHEDTPKGEIFSFVNGKDSPEYEKKINEGWVDTPVLLKLPESNNTGLTFEQVDNARPEDIVKLCESYGFIVMTPEQLKAEANKLIDTVIDLSDFTDEALIEEAERRGLKESANVDEEGQDSFALIEEQFLSDPKSLTKAALVVFGNNQYKLGLRENMKEDTLIEKIKEAITK